MSTSLSGSNLDQPDDHHWATTDEQNVTDLAKAHRGQELTRYEAWCLYLSHFLSMWNSRAYEYGAVLFTQAVFPGDLLPSSLYGIAETICVLVSSSALGQWVDDSPSRLRPLLISIVTNRVTIVVCCAVWLFEFYLSDELLKRLTFGLLLILGMIVKVSRMSNMLSMERDWIPTVASNPIKSGLDLSMGPYDLTHLNTVIRRIDIACKFLAPVAVSGTIAAFNAKPTAAILAFMSITSVIVESWGVLAVWKINARLTASKPGIRKPGTMPYDSNVRSSWLTRCLKQIIRFERLMLSQVDGMRYYFSTNVWLPSIGIAVLHASVLDWSGTLITWLLNAGFSYVEVTLAKGIGSIFEIGSTFVFPLLVDFFRRRQQSNSGAGDYQMIRADGIDDEEDDFQDTKPGGNPLLGAGLEDPSSFRSNAILNPIVQAGHFGIFELLACLLPAVLALFFLDNAIEPEAGNIKPRGDGTAFFKSPVLAIAFFAFLSLSFLGRWIYDLSVTQLTQTLIPASHRSQFGGTEMAMIAGVGLAHWIAAAIWHDQSDYKWLSLGSLFAVATASGLWYVWRKRWNTALAATETS